MSNELKRLPCRRDESGSILITVVWMTLVLSIVAISFSSRLMYELSLVQRLEGDLEAYYLLQTGAELAKSVLLQDEHTAYDSCKEGWCHDAGSFRDQRLGKGSYTLFYNVKERVLGPSVTHYGLADECGKLNLNAAQPQELERLFEQNARLEEGDARALADAIMDWRDEDTDRRPFGAENFDYLAKRSPYESKDGPFESVDELLLVDGMTPKIFRRVAPYLTVYGKGAVNVHTAPEAVLTALGFSSLGANIILSYHNGPDGVAGTEDDQEFPSLPFFVSEFSRSAAAEDVNLIGKLMGKGRLAVGSDAFSFTVTAKANETAKPARAFCVINHQGQTLVWRENAGDEEYAV